jgi:hypothetical protein
LGRVSGHLVSGHFGFRVVSGRVGLGIGSSSVGSFRISSRIRSGRVGYQVIQCQVMNRIGSGGSDGFLGSGGATSSQEASWVWTQTVGLLPICHAGERETTEKLELMCPQPTCLKGHGKGC